jgi:hypothetical protein
LQTTTERLVIDVQDLEQGQQRLRNQ